MSAAIFLVMMTFKAIGEAWTAGSAAPILFFAIAFLAIKGFLT